MGPATLTRCRTVFQRDRVAGPVYAIRMAIPAIIRGIGTDVRRFLFSLAGCALAASVVAAQQGRFRSGIDLVNVAVMVFDRAGQLRLGSPRGRLRGLRERPEADVSVFLRGDAFHSTQTETNSAEPSARPAVRHERQHVGRHRAGAHGRHPVPEGLPRSPGHHAGRLRHRSARRAVRAGRSAAPGRAHPRTRRPTAGRRSTTRSASTSTARTTWTAGRCSSSTPTAATRAAR